jgi:hypothetical protein
MRWQKRALAEMNERLAQMGLVACPVCHGGTLTVWRYPTMESIGDHYRDKGDPQRDPESNVLFMVHVECDLCGHALYFNSERLIRSKTPSLIIGLTEAEEDELDTAEGP